MAQEAPAKQGGESTLSPPASGGVVTSELGLAALYYQQGNYVQAELTFVISQEYPNPLFRAEFLPSTRGGNSLAYSGRSARKNSHRGIPDEPVEFTRSQKIGAIG